MALPDKVILWFFSILCGGGILWVIFSIRRSLKASSENDDGLKMFLWAVNALIGLIVAAAGAVYFIIPLLTFYGGG